MIAGGRRKLFRADAGCNDGLCTFNGEFADFHRHETAIRYHKAGCLCLKELTTALADQFGYRLAVRFEVRTVTALDPDTVLVPLGNIRLEGVQIDAVKLSELDSKALS